MSLVIVTCKRCGKPRVLPYEHLECVTVSGLYTLAQTFEWENEDKTQRMIFDVHRILNAMAHGELAYDQVQSPLDRNWARDWLPPRDLNYAHIDALTPERVDAPVLGVWMEDGSGLLIDGSHRYYARYKRGLDFVRWDIIPFPLWKPFAKDL